MASGHGRADYLLFVDQKAVGAIEAKPSSTPLAGVEPQSAKYSTGLPDGPVGVGVGRCRSCTRRPVTRRCSPTASTPTREAGRSFAFHRPETWPAGYGSGVTMPTADRCGRGLSDSTRSRPDGLRRIQVEAIGKFEASMKANRPRALAQMATGSGKTFMAANLAYRLVQQADAERVLFLVDRANLGRQTLREFQQFATPGDGRKFTDLYNVQWLTSNRIDPAAAVVITTVQRLYSMLRGEEDLAADAGRAVRVGDRTGPPAPTTRS